MMRTSFNADWLFGPKASLFNQIDGGVADTPVTLPHDGMLSLERSPDAPGGPATGYFPSSWVQYTKTFDVPHEWRNRRVSIEFEGVYRDAVIFVNGDCAAQRPSGYVPFIVELNDFLKYGQTNLIRVEARAHLDSRWYSGCGIYRDTHLIVTELDHFASHGVVITTREIDDELVAIDIASTVVNSGTSTAHLSVAAEVHAGGIAVAAADPSPITLRAGTSGVVRQVVYLHEPERWSVDSPNLYLARLSLSGPDGLRDAVAEQFGIRTLQLDPEHGLRINGVPTKLRGACIHHDNGIIGAATIARAEERRVELLKAAGFNAIRSAHNPLSPAMLDACDRLGMLVMDESFDMWAESLNVQDYSLAFAEWWKRDLAAMVAKDINRPSVIMYSIGNEIPDIGRPLGAVPGRAMAEEIRAMDPSRLLTHAISGFISTIGEIVETVPHRIAELRQRGGGVNDLIKELAQLMSDGDLADLVHSRTAESHAIVDVAGYNYAHDLYAHDIERYPNRILVGTESLAKEIDRIWSALEGNPQVIGDFTWTGWDYLGEAGIGGVVQVADPQQSVGVSPYPWLLAYCGDIDITGFRRPASFYREIVYGLRHAPYLTVHRPVAEGLHPRGLEWAWTDSRACWDWDVAEGTPLQVEVHSASPRVDVLLNGVSVGTIETGKANRYRAMLSVPYSRGELVALALTETGAEIGRDRLDSPSSGVRIHAVADRAVVSAGDRDLSYISIELVDDEGRRWTTRDCQLRVGVVWAGVLQGLGSAEPCTQERFGGDCYTTFAGRVLAVVRPTGAGRITVSVAGEGLETIFVELLSE